MSGEAPAPQGMTESERAESLWYALSKCLALDRQRGSNITITTLTHWLDYHGAGVPDVAMSQEDVRRDAAFWASCSHQAELEAYLVASLMELEGSTITNKAAKRLAALGFSKMDLVSREAFKEWMDKK